VRRRLQPAFATELALLGIVLVAQAWLLTRQLHNAVNYDEAVYLAALDDLRHGQALGSDVFAAQFPGFYDLLRGMSYITGVSVTGIRSGLIVLTLLGTVGGWLVGRRYGGSPGGFLAAAFLTIAPPLDLFGFQVIADTPALALMALAAGIATLSGPAAAFAAGALFAGALSVKLTALTVVPVLAELLRRRVWPALSGFGVVAAGIALAHAGALGQLWTDGVTYHSDARSTPAVIPHPHRQILDQIPHRTPFFLLAVAAILLAVFFAISRKRLRVWPLWAWVALSVGFLLTHSPLHYNHLVVFPFSLAIATGATIGAVLMRAPERVRYASVALLALVIAAGWVQQVHRVNLARTREPRSNVEAAQALAKLVPAGSTTVDDRPIISFLAHRQVDGQLVDLARLRFETRSLTDTDVIRRLHTARAVVVSRALADRPRVMRYVKTHFRLRYRRGGVEIYTPS
jgi:hypothetical protein